MHVDSFLFQTFVYLIAAVISVPLAKRLGLGSVLGYLIAGVIIGPFVLGFVGSESEGVMHFAELGVVLMLFLIGLELEPSLLWRLKNSILGLGSLQVFITTALISLITIVVGYSWKEALAIGLILSLSSTAIVLQTLNEKGLLNSQGGRFSFSVLLFQDISLIPILAFLPLLALSVDPGELSLPHSGSESFVESLKSWQRGVLIIAIVSSIILGGRFLSRPVFRFIAETRLREIFTAFSLLLIIATALAMQFVGLSPALGTFVAGVVLANSEYRHELESDIEPFKGLLLGLFFISVGASINFNLLFGNFTIILGIVFLLMALKFVVLFILGRVFKINKTENYLFAFALAQGGEFAFVLFSFATQNSVLPETVSSLLVVVVAITMMLTPLLFIFYEKFIEKRFQESEEKEPDEIDEKNQVIIAGFGRFGQIIGRLLHGHEISTTVLDHDASQIELVRKFGYKVFYGDASRVDLLKSAGCEQAKLFIIAVDDKEKTLQIAREIKSNFPHLKILARSFDRRHTYDLMKLEVDYIKRETFYSALELGIDALMQLGFPAYQARRAALTFKHHDKQTLIDLYEHFGDEKNFIYHSKRRTEDLLNLLMEDEKDIKQADDDLSWERPEDPAEKN
ncbi:MAG TPA: monovalent cation:proton antiporter-2 (CPA2) family protein [Thermodesulfobacteriota bacterium]|nr:monovalent cation:proton antiporter-2 (CPA2) family protein [Thermodesulfobacteriota bacterium]